MRIMILLLIGLLVMMSMPVLAQGEVCTIDLETTIAALFNAQREADRGNTFNAVQTIDTVQADLETLAASCADILFPLPQSFTAPDGSIAFNYPDGWTFSNPQQNLYLVTNSQNAADAVIDDTLDEIQPGEQVLFAFIVTAEIIDLEGETFDAVVTELSDDLTGSYDRVSRPESIEIGGHMAERVTVQQEDTVAIFDFVDYLDQETPALLFLGVVGSADEADMLDVILTAFEGSINYPARLSLRPSGIALDDLSYASAENVRDIDEAIDFRTATLSPDGHTIAYFDPGDDLAQICLYSVNDGAINCDTIPERFNNRPVFLHWSPDSSTIAFTGDFIRIFREVDIWMVDVATRQVVNATDDGIEDWSPFGGEANDPAPIWIDSVMTWGPDGNLYFMRTEFPTADTSIVDTRYGLYRLAPDGGEPELIRDLTGLFAPVPIYYSEIYSLDGVMSVSPDAEQIAFIVRENEQDSFNNGIWLLELDGDEAPRQLVERETFFFGASRRDIENDSPLTPSAMTWNADGSALFVLADNSRSVFSSIEARAMAYHIDAETGQATLLTDIGNPEDEDFVVAGDDGLTAGFPMARAAVLTPDGDGLLILNQNTPPIIAGISALRITENGGEQALLYRVDDFQPLPAMNATIGTDGTVLMFGYLFRPER